MSIRDPQATDNDVPEDGAPDGGAPDSGAPALSAAQCRAARGLLNWDQSTLAKRAGIARATVIDFESGKRTPSRRTTTSLGTCLEAEGVRFIAEGGEEGCVVFRKQ